MERACMHDAIAANDAFYFIKKQQRQNTISFENHATFILIFMLQSRYVGSPTGEYRTTLFVKYAY